MTELPLPCDVPGFAAAVTAGLTPARPAHPPVVRRPSAHQMLLRLAAVTAASVAASIMCVFFGPLQRMLGPATLPVFFAVMAVGYVFYHAALVRFRTVWLDELQAGYTTTTFVQGSFWFSSSRAPETGPEEGLGWSWEGLWTLTSDGRVVSAPNPAAYPPGLYPSPRAPGRRELWTGRQWAHVFFDNTHR